MGNIKLKVIVSGATGLLGSHILRKLIQKNEYEVVGLHRKSSQLDLVQDIYVKLPGKLGTFWILVSLIKFVMEPIFLFILQV